MGSNEEIREIERPAKPTLDKPSGREVFYPPESRSPKRQLEAGEVSANPIVEHCPVCYAALDAVSGLCDNSACRTYRKKRCVWCPPVRKNDPARMQFIALDQDMCNTCADESD